MLVGAGVQIGDVVGRLEPLVGQGIPQRRARAFQDRQHRLAAPRGDAAKDVAHPILGQNVAAQGRVKVYLAARVTLDRDKAHRQGGIGVHLGDPGQRALAAGAGDGLVAARARLQKPDVHRPLHHYPPTQKAPSRETGRGPDAMRRRYVPPRVWRMGPQVKTIRGAAATSAMALGQRGLSLGQHPARTQDRRCAGVRSCPLFISGLDTPGQASDAGPCDRGVRATGLRSTL